MVHRLHDTRLLENLVKTEKEYSAALVNLLVISNASLNTLSTFGSASPPTLSKAILGVTTALSGADKALEKYSASIDDWREKLKEIKRLEGEIDTIVRDREILVTRLLKTSKQKPARDTFRNHGATAAQGIARENTLIASKLVLAQSELQACEVHLSEKQSELNQITQSAIKDGLQRRCKALLECGSTWSEKGYEGLRSLGMLSETSGEDVLRGLTYPQYPPRLRPFSPGSGHNSTTSLAPSQSASQIAVNIRTTRLEAPTSPSDPAPLAEVDPNPRVQPSSSVVVTLNSPLPPLPSSASDKQDSEPDQISSIIPPVQDQEGRPPTPAISYRLSVPPAHSIEDHVLPSGTAESTYSDSSSDDDQGPLEIRENTRTVGDSGPVPLLPSHLPAKEPSAVPSLVISAPKSSPMTNPPLVPSYSNGPQTPPDSQSRPPRNVNSEQQKPSPPLTPTRSQNKATSTPGRSRDRSGSFSLLLESIVGLFKSSSGSSQRANNSPTQPSTAHLKAVKPNKQANGFVPQRIAGKPNKGWNTRTDENIARGHQDGSSTDDDRIPSASSLRIHEPNSQLHGRRRNTLKRSRSSKKQSPGYCAVAQSSLARAVHPEKSTMSDIEHNPTGRVQRRVSKHSSDGALTVKGARNDRASSIPDRAVESRARSPHAKQSMTNRLQDTMEAKIGGEHGGVPPSQEVYSTTPQDVKHNPVNGATKTNPDSKGQRSRKKSLNRGPSKSPRPFDDGLGSSGGALVIRGPTIPQSDGFSIGADGRPKSPLLESQRRSSQYEVIQNSIARSNVELGSVKYGHGRDSSGGSKSKNNRSHQNGISQTGPSNLVPAMPYHSFKESDTSSSPTKRGSLEVGNPHRMGATTSTVKNTPLPPIPSTTSSPALPQSKPEPDPQELKLLLPSSFKSMSPINSHDSALDGYRLGSSGVIPALPTPVVPRSASNQVASKPSAPLALVPVPLRSALRSRSPSPRQPPASGLSHRLAGSLIGLSMQGNHESFPSSSTATTPSLTAPQHNADDMNDMDSLSMTSYETGLEEPEETADYMQQSTPLASPTGTPLHGILLHSGEDARERKGTDLSVSLSSDTTSQPPIRKKSVRMALPPSTHITQTTTQIPPAPKTDRMNKERSKTGVIIPGPGQLPPRAWSSRIAEETEPSAWDDSSEEDVDYGAARTALARATKALASAGDLRRRKGAV